MVIEDGHGGSRVPLQLLLFGLVDPVVQPIGLHLQLPVLHDLLVNDLLLKRGLNLSVVVPVVFESLIRILPVDHVPDARLDQLIDVLRRDYEVIGAHLHLVL